MDPMAWMESLRHGGLFTENAGYLHPQFTLCRLAKIERVLQRDKASEIVPSLFEEIPIGQLAEIFRSNRPGEAARVVEVLRRLKERKGDGPDLFRIFFSKVWDAMCQAHNVEKDCEESAECLRLGDVLVTVCSAYRFEPLFWWKLEQTKSANCAIGSQAHYTYAQLAEVLTLQSEFKPEDLTKVVSLSEEHHVPAALFAVRYRSGFERFEGRKLPEIQRLARQVALVAEALREVGFQATHGDVCLAVSRLCIARKGEPLWDLRIDPGEADGKGYLLTLVAKEGAKVQELQYQLEGVMRLLCEMPQITDIRVEGPKERTLANIAMHNKPRKLQGVQLMGPRLTEMPDERLLMRLDLSLSRADAGELQRSVRRLESLCELKLSVVGQSANIHRRLECSSWMTAKPDAATHLQLQGDVHSVDIAPRGGCSNLRSLTYRPHAVTAQMADSVAAVLLRLKGLESVQLPMPEDNPPDDHEAFVGLVVKRLEEAGSGVKVKGGFAT